MRGLPPRDTEGQKVSGSSDPPSPRKRRLADDLLNQLQQRQVSGHTSQKFGMRQRFSQFLLRLRLDVYRPPVGAVDQIIDRRSRITEICTTESLAFGLTENGICAGFDMSTGKRICFLNSSAAEVVRSLFHNKSNGTLITVSVFASDDYSSLQCRANLLSHLSRGDTSQSSSLFTSESLKWPGFVEFDDVNGKVLTYSAADSMYKVWSMADPTITLYSLPDQQIDEIKISPGIMLLVLKHDRKDAFIPLRILCIETGMLLRDVKHPLIEELKIDIIEQFNEKLLIKQEDLPLCIVDLLRQDAPVVTVSHQQFETPTAFIFLYETQTFLAFKGNMVTVWNFQGELVSSFDDHRLWLPLPDIDHTSVIYITQSQDVIMSLCSNSDEQGVGATEVAVHISSILTGQCLSKIDWKSAGADPVTALCYNEERGDIVIGNEAGVLQIWSN